MRSGIRPRRFLNRLQILSWLGIGSITLTGCLSTPQNVSYIGRDKPLTDYLDSAMRTAHPVISNDLGDIRTFPNGPRTIKERLDAEQTHDVTLAQCRDWALLNNKIVRFNDRGGVRLGQTRGDSFDSPSSRALSGGDQAASSVYDPAIQETGVLFGARGIESALSAFDAQWTTRFNTGNSQLVQNNIFNGAGLPAGSTLNSDNGQFVSAIQKQFADSTSVTLSHEVDYIQNNIPTALFPSNYTGNIAANIRRPLLAGAGVNFTRIAGPVGQNIQGLSGVNQGVVIARINNDIAIADFEAAVNNMIFDVEKAYWDLHLAYRNWKSAQANRLAGERNWQEIEVKRNLGAEGGGGLEESQARDAYFDRVAQEDAALAEIDRAEGSLRRLCGLPLNDNAILRPTDEPIIAEFKPDWNADLAMALTRRVELRRQKWNIKSWELQLDAAKSFTKPRLDFVGNYQLNGFGDKLMSDHVRDGRTEEGFNNFYDSMLRGHQTSWTAGAEFSMPFGFRAANAQVRNLELRVAKARETLRVQEDDVIYELALAYQDLAINWANAQTQFNRRIAAEDQTKFVKSLMDASVNQETNRRPVTLRDLLEAQAHLAQADAAYFQSIINYNKTIANIHYKKGSLLEFHNVFLQEGTWDPKAYEDALTRAWERTYSLKHPLEDHMTTEPAPFAVDADPGTSTYGLDPNAPPPTNSVPYDTDQPALNEPQGVPGIEVPEVPAKEAAAESATVESPEKPIEIPNPKKGS